MHNNYFVCIFTGKRSAIYFSIIKMGFPPLDLVVQSEVRALAHRLWSLGSWS
jgi:hypothetical protein